MTCNECGAQINDDIKFCPYCGASVARIDPTSQNQGFDPYDPNLNPGYGQNNNSGSYTPDPNFVPAPKDQTYGAQPVIVNLSPWEYYKLFWKNYTKFDGRSRRSEYWWPYLFNMVISMILSLLGGVPGVIFSLAILIPNISCGVRRLHDTGRKGIYYLFCLIPIVGPILLIVWFATEGQPGMNEYGPNPKGIGNPF